MERSGEELPALLATHLVESFAQLVLTFQHQLYVFALRQCGSPQEAEDIVQEAFLHAYVTLENYPAQRIRELKLSAWLYKITLYVYYNRRRKVRLLEEPLDLSEESRQLELEDRWQERPEVLFENAELLKELEAWMVTLPDSYRLTINCYYFADMSYQEIADLLNQPLGTVKSNIYRGLRMLRLAMGT